MRVEVVAGGEDTVPVQPRQIRRRGIGCGCGAFFGDDAHGFGFAQMRKDASEVGVGFVRPRPVCKRADAVGNANDGGDFVFGQSEPAPAKQPLCRAVGNAGQRGGQADGFGVAQIDGGNGVVAKV